MLHPSDRMNGSKVIAFRKVPVSRQPSRFTPGRRPISPSAVCGHAAPARTKRLYATACLPQSPGPSPPVTHSCAGLSRMLCSRSLKNESGTTARALVGPSGSTHRPGTMYGPAAANRPSSCRSAMRSLSRCRMRERAGYCMETRNSRPDQRPPYCGWSLSATRLARNIRSVPSLNRTLMLMSLPSGRIWVISPAPNFW